MAQGHIESAGSVQSNGSCSPTCYSSAATRQPVALNPGVPPCSSAFTGPPEETSYLNSLRLLHDVQRMPGTDGEHARNLVSFLQKRWWAQARSGAPSATDALLHPLELQHLQQQTANHHHDHHDHHHHHQQSPSQARGASHRERLRPCASEASPQGAKTPNPDLTGELTVSWRWGICKQELSPPVCGDGLAENSRGTSASDPESASPGKRFAFPPQESRDSAQREAVDGGPSTQPPSFSSFSPCDLLPRSASVPEGLGKASAVRCALKVQHLHEGGEDFFCEFAGASSLASPCCQARSSPRDCCEHDTWASASSEAEAEEGAEERGGDQSGIFAQVEACCKTPSVGKASLSQEDLRCTQRTETSVVRVISSLRTKLWSGSACPSDASVIKQPNPPPLRLASPSAVPRSFSIKRPALFSKDNEPRRSQTGPSPAWQPAPSEEERGESPLEHSAQTSFQSLPNSLLNAPSTDPPGPAVDAASFAKERIRLSSVVTVRGARSRSASVHLVLHHRDSEEEAFVGRASVASSTLTNASSLAAAAASASGGVGLSSSGSASAAGDEGGRGRDAETSDSASQPPSPRAGDKVLVETLEACSWVETPGRWACAIQRHLASSHHRHLSSGQKSDVSDSEVAPRAEETVSSLRSSSPNRNSRRPPPRLCETAAPERKQVASAAAGSAEEDGLEAAGSSLRAKTLRREERGVRYVPLSDCLRQYPEVLVSLIKGPLAQRLQEKEWLRLHGGAPRLAREPPPSGGGGDGALCLWMGAFAIPRDDKRYRGGEDAWFFDFQTSGLGVADGVSEWEELAGVNPQEYAIDLMRGAKDALLKRRAERAFPRPCEEAAAGIGSASRLNDKAPAATATGTENPPPSQVAREALTTAYEEASHFGSSTAIVGVLDGHSGVFGIANMGDSSGMVLRRSSCGGELSIVRRIREMQHAFNVPFQFAKLPGREDWERLNASGLGRLVDIARREAEKGDVSSVGDPPSKIETANVSVKEGDLIILATDGLFDNVFDFEIVALAGLAVSPMEARKCAGRASLATPPGDVARSLALAAYWKSLDRNSQTPFSKEARRCSVLHAASPANAASDTRGMAGFFSGLLSGGKEDDITVAVAWVCRRDGCVSSAASTPERRLPGSRPSS